MRLGACFTPTPPMNTTTTKPSNQPEPLALSNTINAVVGHLQRQLADAEGELEEIAALPASAISTDTEMDERYANGRIEAYKDALTLLTGATEPPPADQIVVACLAIQRLAGEAALTADAIENQPEERIDYDRLEQLRTSREAYLAALRAVLAIEPHERPSTQAEILEAIQQQQREADEARTRLLTGDEDVGPETQLELYRLKIERETWDKALALLSTTAPARP